MKKIFFLLLCLCLVSACDTAKRSRLASDTLQLKIDPPTGGVVLKGQTLALTAVCRTPLSENADVIPEWYCDGSLGTLSPRVGKTTVFTAGTTVSRGGIYAQAGSVTASIAASVVRSTSALGNLSDVFGLYSETYVTPAYEALKYDTANPPTIGGGCMGKYGNAVISDGTLSGQYSEGSHGLKCDIPLAGSPGGWWIQFGSDSVPGCDGDVQVPADMAEFSAGSLKFDVKTTRDVLVKIEWSGGGSASFRVNADLGIPTDGNWHAVTIPLSSNGIDFEHVTVPAGFHSGGLTNYTYYIDNVRWEK